MILNDIGKSGNILTLYFEDEKKGLVEKRYILHFDDIVVDYEDLYSGRKYNVRNGIMALFVVLKKGACDYYCDEKEIALFKGAESFFVGDTIESVEKKLKKYLVKEKKIKKNLVIIDFEQKDNQIKLYLGNKTCKDYWGDDWDDSPADCNAGTVYKEYVKDTATINIMPEKGQSVHPYHPEEHFCKEDFKKGHPFLYITNKENENRYYRQSYSSLTHDVEGYDALIFGQDLNELKEKGYFITE